MSSLKLLSDYRIVLLIGAIWGILASVSYYSIVTPQPLPLAGLLAFTVFLPGLVGKIIVYNTFQSLLWSYKEPLAAAVGMITGMAILYFPWSLSSIATRARKC